MASATVASLRRPRRRSWSIHAAPRRPSASRVREVSANRQRAAGHGLSETQRRALATTIETSVAEVVVATTPIDLVALLSIGKPVVRARYEFSEDSAEPLLPTIDAFLLHHPVPR